MKLFLLPIILTSVVVSSTPTDTLPEKYQICDWISVELQLAVENGYLTQEEATDVIERCYS